MDLRKNTANRLTAHGKVNELDENTSADEALVSVELKNWKVKFEESQRVELVKSNSSDLRRGIVHLSKPFSQNCSVKIF